MHNLDSDEAHHVRVAEFPDALRARKRRHKNANLAYDGLMRRFAMVVMLMACGSNGTETKTTTPPPSEGVTIPPVEEDPEANIKAPTAAPELVEVDHYWFCPTSGMCAWKPEQCSGDGCKPHRHAWCSLLALPNGSHMDTCFASREDCAERSERVVTIGQAKIDQECTEQRTKPGTEMPPTDVAVAAPHQTLAVQPVPQPADEMGWFCSETKPFNPDVHSSNCEPSRRQCEESVERLNEGDYSPGYSYGPCARVNGVACISYKLIVANEQAESCFSWMNDCLGHQKFLTTGPGKNEAVIKHKCTAKQ
jgi:hypothetical protein